MKNIKILMMIVGFIAISACSSNEKMDAAESDAKAEAEMMKQEQAAAMNEEKAEAEVEAVAVAEEVVEVAEAEAEAETAMMDESDAEASASGNLVSTCENGEHVRVIRVVYDNPETDTVCEVTYEKSTGVQTLWSANNERDYCLDKAAAFVEKQEGWGWTCSNLE
jgi:ABC-type molybdate transport system substrate-binding protein